MRFSLIDAIQTIEPGKRIVATKALSLAEEYLADHFPAFPVLPGVLMLEALTQSAAWLVRIQQDFARSIVVLKAARSVKYSYFVQPGSVLRCEVTALRFGDESSQFTGAGFVGDRKAVSARLELASLNLGDRQARLSDTDAQIVRQLRQQFSLLRGPEALQRGAEGS